MTDGTDTTTYQYDTSERLATASRTAGTFGYAHDAQGQLTQPTYPV